MRGAIDLAVEYARSRRQFGPAIGSFQAVQHLLADAYVSMEGSVAWPGTRRGRSTRSPADDALAAGALAKAYCARAARTVCETSIQVHGGHGQHLGMPGPVCTSGGPSSPASSSAGSGPTSSGCSPTTGSEATMDFGDSPEEAGFRLRLRAWLEEHDPGLPTSSTDDAYWAGQAAWHRSLYDGGFFGITWPEEIGGQGLPAVYDVIVDEELAAAGAPPRPSLGYLVEGILEHGSDDVQAPLPARHRQRAGSVVPGLQRARRRVGPGLVAHPRRPGRRRVRAQRAQGLDELLRRCRLVPGPGPYRSRGGHAQGHLGVRRARCTSPASSSARCP